MVHVRFKNMDGSKLVREIVRDRVESVVSKFPDLQQSRVGVTVEMENSPQHPGRDQFTVRLHIYRGRFHGITVAKSASDLYVGLAELVEHLLEKLNRSGDKSRVRERNQARRFLKEWEPRRAS